MRAALGIGSNLGDRAGYLRLAEDGLRELGPIVVSSYHETEPVGPPQPMYLNSAAIVECDLAPAELHRFCNAVEDRAKRVRGDRWGPRTLDVDLLLCDDLMLESDALTIPHPGLPERIFVLAPLSEIAGDWVVPGLDRTVDELHEACRIHR